MSIPEVPPHQPRNGQPGHGNPDDTAEQQTQLGNVDAVPTGQDAPWHGGPSTAPPKGSRKPTLFGAIGLVIGLLLGVIGTLSVNGIVQAASAASAAEAEANKPKPLAEAVNKCNLSSQTISAKLGDDGHTLSLDGKGKEDLNGLAWIDIECALEAVNVPDYVREQMGSTRALDGTQRESWGNFSAAWSYHPDSGMNVVLRFTDV